MSGATPGELVFFCGTMNCGKSTLALQVDHNHASRGRVGLVFSVHDRAGVGRLSSRLGLAVPAVDVGPAFSFADHVVSVLQRGGRVDYLVCDEAQFYSPGQVDELARLVDEAGVDVYAFGITTDFRARLFPGSARLLELADRVETLQVQALCWCGRRGTHNARTLDGVMVTDGDQVVVGDVAEADGPAPTRGVVGYEVVCRAHHRRRLTAAVARVVSPGADVLPFDQGPRA